MRIIICDFKNIDKSKFKEDDVILTGKDAQSCVGCFSCWFKHPMECNFNDALKYNGKLILESDKLIIISKCVYGCYSSLTKKILERSLGYVEPFMTIREKEIHHKGRISKKINFDVYFYGNIDSFDKEVATCLVNANKKNLNANSPNIYFYKTEDEVINNI